MEGYKYAGVTLDFYDDNGDTLKQRFPTKESLPDFIKKADVRPKEKLSNEDFALVMVDKGHVYRKYACYDPGTTAMSTIYFMEHGEKLPDAAQKLAAANLVEACRKFDFMAPEAMQKLSFETQSYSHRDGKTYSVHGTNRSDIMESWKGRGWEPKTYDGMPGYWQAEHEVTDPDVLRNTKQAMADVTGKRPSPKVKMAAPTSDDDYAVVLPNGSKHYPINSWDRVKTAEAYWLEEKRRMDPEIRRHFAVKLAQKAYQIGYHVDEAIVEAGSKTYHGEDFLRDAIDMRKVACSPEDDSRQFLEDLFEKRAELNPEVYAECLRRFDINSGLDQGWDSFVLDPWASTFGIDKTASLEVVWEEGADRVTEDALTNLARNHLARLEDLFNQDLIKGFLSDPVGVFKSLPTPQKKLLSRLANDSESMGHSEFNSTKAPEQGSEGTKRSA